MLSNIYLYKYTYTHMHTPNKEKGGHGFEREQRRRYIEGFGKRKWKRNNCIIISKD